MVWTGPDSRGRLAKSLVVLFKQIEDRYSDNRDTSSDGTIGDVDHETRRSEHNVRNTSTPGICRALDITNDPAHGVVSNDIAHALIASRDPRIDYVISNGQIASSSVSPWKWRTYSGSNKHNRHFHVSVKENPRLYDDAAPWKFTTPERPITGEDSAARPPTPVLKLGSKGTAVQELQKLLKIPADGIFGKNTKTAVQLFQAEHRLDVDGIVGPYTWDALRGKHPEKPKYTSLIKGGFFSSNPYDRSVRTSIRTNNPGAVNGAAWEEQMPGYVTTDLTTPGNRTTIFLTPEHGVTTYWELLRRYREGGDNTVAEIINRYGGGQDYSQYVKFVRDKTGLKPDTDIDLMSNEKLLPFAKAMFRYEAGQEIPWSDEQILLGFELGRKLRT